MGDFLGRGALQGSNKRKLRHCTILGSLRDPFFLGGSQCNRSTDSTQRTQQKIGRQRRSEKGRPRRGALAPGPLSGSLAQESNFLLKGGAGQPERGEDPRLVGGRAKVGDRPTAPRVGDEGGGVRRQPLAGAKEPPDGRTGWPERWPKGACTE